jgi:hypothetical protein
MNDVVTSPKPALRPLGSYADAAAALGMKVSSLYQLTSRGALPRNVYIGHGRWNLDKLEAHIGQGTIFTKPVNAQYSSSRDKIVSKDNYKSQISEVRDSLR